MAQNRENFIVFSCLVVTIWILLRSIGIEFHQTSPGPSKLDLKQLQDVFDTSDRVYDYNIGKRTLKNNTVKQQLFRSMSLSKNILDKNLFWLQLDSQISRAGLFNLSNHSGVLEAQKSLSVSKIVAVDLLDIGNYI